MGRPGVVRSGGSGSYIACFMRFIYLAYLHRRRPRGVGRVVHAHHQLGLEPEYVVLMALRLQL